MELHAEGRPPVGEAANNLSCLRVPQVDEFVKAGTEELAAIVGEADVAHGLRVATVRSNALPMRHGVPNFAGAVMAGRKQQVTGLGEELDALDTAVVPCPRVHPLLGDEAVMLLVAQVARRLHKALPCLVKDSSVAVVD